MVSQPTLLDVLQAEFCPPLDSSLVAAIAADYILDCATPASNASEELQIVRNVLSGLASQAEKELFHEDALSDRVSRIRISPQSVTDDTSSSQDFFSTDYSTSHTGASSASDPPSPQSLSSALGFLKAAFPHLSTEKLKSALAEHGHAEDVDMEAVVESVLTKEYVRDLEERGFEDSEFPEDPEEQWLTVQSKRKNAGPGAKIAKKSKKGTTYTLVDVRQKQHAPTPTQEPRMSGSDPWTQVSSVASYLSTLLPQYSASYFQSIFHSPNHPTPAAALRAALTSLCKSLSRRDDLSLEETNVLVSLLDILRASPMYDTLNAEERSQLTSDAQLALRVTDFQPDQAFDLVRLLRDLESDYASGDLTWGVYHSPPPPPPSVSKHAVGPPSLKGTLKLPIGPPAIQPPPRSPASPMSKAHKPSPNAWQTVQPRSPSYTPNPHTSFIPSYGPVAKKKVRGAGNGIGKGGKGDVGELTSRRGRMMDLMERRREALREAGRAWQKTNTKTYGGEIAFFYAERARELQQQAKDEQLEATREMVLAKRQSSAKQDAIDLHGATASEAIQIARDILAQEGASAANPLRIITGRGNHSINGVSIIGPAVKAALVSDGWAVGSYDGGLVVRGHR